MGKGKKIGIGIGVAFGILVVLGIIASTVNQEGSKDIVNDTSSGPDEGQSTTGNSGGSGEMPPTVSLMDILPKREDIGTQWVISPPNSNATTFSEYGGIFSYTVTDFEEAIQQRFVKNNPVQDFKVSAYRFNTSEKAEEFHTDLVARMQERGGYTEYRTSETSAISANCYATTYREGNLDFYCVKQNIFYHLNAITGVVSGDIDQFHKDAVQFAGIVASKIR
jgi:hypothetical protein